MAGQMSSEQAKELAGDYRDLNKERLREIDLLTKIKEADERRKLASEAIANNQKVINALEKEFLAGNKEVKAELDAINKLQKALIAKEEAWNKKIENQLKSRKKIVDLTKQLGAQLKIGWKYLQSQDKVIKSTTLSLGMSGQKAVAMRDAFEKSAGYVARLGGSIEDVATVMQGYADETGRARALSAEMVQDIADIGRGTGLGVAQATKLGAQFEIMGYDAKATLDYVQGVVDTSERMGVNTTKVLKAVSDNFKRLNTYTFQQGAKGMAEMAMYAEKFKVDIGSALNAADVARSLGGAIDLAAQLQVMGGEFAKTDPFELLYLSRNDPAEMQKRIGEMTKGIVTFRKMAGGGFEKFISPADRDRMAQVAKSLNIEVGALTEIAQRQAEINKLRQQTAGMGLSKEQQELIEGEYTFNQEAGKFQVKLSGVMTNITELTKEQAQSFASEQKLLKERATEALTFDETFKATINILKASLIPLLKTINTVAEVTIKPIADMAAKGGWGLAGAAGTLLLAGAVWKGVVFGLNRFAGGAAAKIGGVGKMGRATPSGIKPGAVGSSFTKTGQIRKGAAGLSKAQGKSSMMKGAGVGAAAVGIGAGVAIAAVGISKLADAMAKLTDEQAKRLQNIAITLAVSFPLAAVGLGIFGATATASAPGLLALGAAILMVGAAVGIAAGGIGFMAKGFAELFTAAADAGDVMPDVVKGVGGVVAALAMGNIALPAAIGMSLVLHNMGKNAPAIATLGASLETVKAALTGNREDYEAIAEAIKTIGGTKLRRNNAISQMADMMSKPLKVEFDKGKVNIVSDITLEIDGDKLMRKSFNQKALISRREDLKNNKGENNQV